MLTEKLQHCASQRPLSSIPSASSAATRRGQATFRRRVTDLALVRRMDRQTTVVTCTHLAATRINHSAQQILFVATHQTPLDVIPADCAESFTADGRIEGRCWSLSAIAMGRRSENISSVNGMMVGLQPEVRHCPLGQTLRPCSSLCNHECGFPRRRFHVGQSPHTISWTIPLLRETWTLRPGVPRGPFKPQNGKKQAPDTAKPGIPALGLNQVFALSVASLRKAMFNKKTAPPERAQEHDFSLDTQTKSH